MPRTPKFLPTEKPAFLNMRVPREVWDGLSRLANEDYRTRPDTVLVLIISEIKRRYPNGLPETQEGSTSIQAATGPNRG